MQPFMPLERNAAWPQHCGRALRSRKPDSGHFGTISITVRVRRAGALCPR
jgi:hypothetical protein